MAKTVPMSCSQRPDGYRPDRRAGTSNGCAGTPDSPCGKTWETPGRPAPGARLQGALHPHRRTSLKKVPGHHLQPPVVAEGRLWSARSGNAFANPMSTDAPIGRRVHRTTIPEIDVPSHHTDAAQQRGQEQQVNPGVRSIGIRPPTIPPEVRGPSRSSAPAPPGGGMNPTDGVPPP